MQISTCKSNTPKPGAHRYSTTGGLLKQIAEFHLQGLLILLVCVCSGGSGDHTLRSSALTHLLTALRYSRMCSNAGTCSDKRNQTQSPATSLASSGPTISFTLWAPSSLSLHSSSYAPSVSGRKRGGRMVNWGRMAGMFMCEKWQ